MLQRLSVRRRDLVPDETGRRIGTYELRARIGVGGVGVVYEAIDDLGQFVAIKLLLPRQLGDPDAVRRFRDEAIAGRIIRHPNVTATIEHGVSKNAPFLVMQLVRGQPLGQRIRREGGPSLRRAVTITRQILAGLGALHAVGIVHGDVKSDNVLVDASYDEVKLIDFGLARVQFGKLASTRQVEDEVAGTPAYMAPEVIRGRGASTASDLYSVGIILYELITGSTPFGGGTRREIVRRQLSDRVIPPSLRRTEVPPILERIVLRALDKHPLRRFASAASFSSALEIALPVLDDRTPRRSPRSATAAPTQSFNGTSSARSLPTPHD